MILEIFFYFFSAIIIPVVQKQHQLLVTLLLCNAAAMEVSCLTFVSFDDRSIFVSWFKILIDGTADSIRI